MGNAYIQTISAETFISDDYRWWRSGKCHRWYLKLKNGLQIITDSNEIFTAAKYLKYVYNMRSGDQTFMSRPGNRFYVRFSDKSMYDTDAPTDRVDFNKTISFINTDEFGSENLKRIGRRIARIMEESYPTLWLDGYNWGIGAFGICGESVGFCDAFDELYKLSNELYATKNLSNANKIQYFDDVLSYKISRTESRKLRDSVSDKQKIKMCDAIISSINYYEFTHIFKYVNDAPNITALYDKCFRFTPFYDSFAENLNFGELTVFERNYLLLWHDVLLRAGNNRIVFINLPEIGLPVTLQREFITNLNTLCNKLHWQAIVVTLSNDIMSGFEDKIVTPKITKYV